MLRRVVVLFVLGSTLLAACGGDDGGSLEGGTDAGTTGGTDAGTDAGGVAGVIGAGECAEVAAAMAAAAQGSSAAISGSATDLEQSLAQMEAFAEAVPEEIRAQMETMLAGYRAIAEALQGSGYDPASGEAPPPEVIAELAQVSEELQSEEFLAAVQAVNAYLVSGCQA